MQKWKLLLLLVLVMLMLFVFVAQADAAASCVAACVRGIAAAALRLTVRRCWAAGATRTYVGTVFSFVCFCFWFAPLPHVPTSLLNLGGVACRISFTFSANTNGCWWEGNALFLAERR